MLTDSELSAAAVLAEELAHEAVARICEGRPAQISTKANAADLMTDIDVAVERHVKDIVLQRYPGHRVVGEELGASGAAPGAGTPTWYLDPVDGTTNLAHGIPWCSFSLALTDERGPVVAVVADPWRGEVFAAVRGRGATLNGRTIRCADATSLAGTVVMTEWSGHQPWPGMFDMLSGLSERLCTVRLMGSSALALVTTASGRAAAAVIGSYHDVDDMAGVLVAREAGAVVRGRGGSDQPGPDGVLVAAPGVADELSCLWSTLGEADRSFAAAPMSRSAGGAATIQATPHILGKANQTLDLNYPDTDSGGT
jgi:fructose-1,6-bisphosphatase/inositol monophosphatase family enzyme